MPRNRRNGSEPPPTMTWRKATPLLIMAGIFDLLRVFFEMFWFFGPALAALYCTAKTSALVGTVLGGFACSAGAGAIGFFGAGPIAAFGAVMAIAVGLLGWMTIGFLLMTMNARIFKEHPTNTLVFVASLGIAEIPLIGTIPSFTLALWRMYHLQIRVESTAKKRWQEEQNAMQSREQEQQNAQLMQARSAELAAADV